MAPRIWWSVGDIWRQHIRENPDGERLPLVLPMVVHHSAKGWTAATCIRELLATTPAVCEAMGEQLPQLGFYLDDLSTQADEELMDRP